MGLHNVTRLSFKDLTRYTNDFCEENYIGYFQFGKFYRGKVAETAQNVFVKIWEFPKFYPYYPGDNERRLLDEIFLLRHGNLINHSLMVKLYGYCFEGDNLGVVYQFNPSDSVYNLIPQDDFSWRERIKVAIRLASLLTFLHNVNIPGSRPFAIRNLDSAHIVLDKEFNPKLCDFGMITGGIFPDREFYTKGKPRGSDGYVDASACIKAPDYPDKKDVFAFGVILLSLISKRAYNSKSDRPKDDVPCLHAWALGEFIEFFYGDDEDENKKFSLVHSSLADDPDFYPDDGYEVTSLGIRCVKGCCTNRPTMDEVMSCLRQLEVVKKHAAILGVKK